MEAIQRLMAMPGNAWRYSRQHPYEAFCYSALVLLGAWLARIFLSLIALILIGGSIAAIIRSHPS